MGMKAKTIKKVIRAKVDDWLVTVEDESLRDKLRNSVVVTGGAIASMLLGDKVSDFDVYLRDQESCRRAAEYYVDRFKVKAHAGVPVRIGVDVRGDRVRIVVKSAGVASENGTDTPYQYFEGRLDDEAGTYVGEVMGAEEVQDLHDETEAAVQAAPDDEDGKPRYRPIFLSTNAITLSNRLQVVIRFYGEPDEIHDNYDFVHCTCYWTSWDDRLVLRPAALESLLSRELRYTGSKYPICSLIRIRKFVGRGWTINAGQILKMAWQVSELDLKDLEVLQDQLTGVDAAYFFQVVQALKEKDPDKVNAAYLIEIIDRLF